MAGIAGFMTADGAAPNSARIAALARGTAGRGLGGVADAVFGGLALVQARFGDSGPAAAEIVTADHAAIVLDG